MINNIKQSSLEEEIDLFEIITKLINEKWKIIIIFLVSLIVGTLTNLNKPSNYKVSFDITLGPDLAFLRYLKINEILSSISFPFEDNELENKEAQYILNANNTLNKFLIQFSNRKGIIKVISEKPYSEMFIESENFDKTIQSIAKNFTIFQQAIRDDLYTIEFYWHDRDQIRNLANSTIQETLNFVKEEIIEDLRSIKDFVEEKNLRALEQINDKQNLLLLQENDLINNRLTFLNEQLNIAKKLGIQYNSLEGGIISSTFSETESYSFTTSNKNSAPYYLIGYEAIIQEINNLVERKDSDKLLLSDPYLNLIKNKRQLENDTSAEDLNDAIRFFADEDTTNWLSYNISFIDIKDLKRSNTFIMLISSIIGLALGIFYVLFSSLFRKNYKHS